MSKKGWANGLSSAKGLICYLGYYSFSHIKFHNRGLLSIEMTSFLSQDFEIIYLNIYSCCSSYVKISQNMADADHGKQFLCCPILVTRQIRNINDFLIGCKH